MQPYDGPMLGGGFKLVDPEVETLLASSAARTVPRSVSAVRMRLGRITRGLPPGPVMWREEDIAVRGAGRTIRARRYLPSRNGPAPGIALYFHGGGWVAGGLEESEPLCRTIAASSGWEVVSLAYALAPEHPFPAAIQDADAALTEVARLAQGRPLAVVGDGTGATLAAVAARRARDRPGPELALQVLAYPYTQPSQDLSSYREHGEAYLLTSPAIAWFWQHYLPDVERRSCADASPLHADSLSGLPPAYILVAEFDAARDDGLLYAERLVEEGVEVTVDHYESMIHGFLPLVGMLSAAGAAAESIGQALAAAA